jgi:hypothetical protein
VKAAREHRDQVQRTTAPVTKLPVKA